MKKLLCFFMAVLLCVGILPLSVFSAELTLYVATTDVISTECGQDTCRIYICENDCYMDIDDIVRYTRSAYTAENDTLTVTHGTREINIDLKNNKLTEDGITAEMKTLRNENAIAVHAAPMLTYLGATCSFDSGFLKINMPERTLWEGLSPVENEDYVSMKIFGGKGMGNIRLGLNCLLSLLQSDLAHACGIINLRDAALLTTQVDVLDYVADWDNKLQTDEKQADFFEKVMETGDVVLSYEDSVEVSNTVYDITLDAVEASLDDPTVFKEFSDHWSNGMIAISDSFIFLKNFNTYKKAAEDSAAVFSACNRHFSSDSDYNSVVAELSIELHNEMFENVGTALYSSLESLMNNGLQKALEMGSKEFSLALNASIIITDLLDGERDAFAYATAETNAINLLYLKEDVGSALERLGNTILEENYSNTQNIEDYRLLKILYYRILIAANEQLYQMIAAQGRAFDADMEPVVEQLHKNSKEFAKNLYVLTMAKGAAFPSIDEISAANAWDENEAIASEAKEVSGGLAGLGAAPISLVLGDVEADSIVYYQCTDPVDFCVIERDGKYGLIDYSGNIILPVEYQSIALTAFPGGKPTKLFAFDSDYNGYWIEKDGTTTPDFFPAWGIERGAELYWNNEIVMFDNMEGKKPYSYKEYASYTRCNNVLGTITSGTPDIVPVQEINGYRQTTSGGMTTYSVYTVTEKYALLNLKTETLVTDFIFDDYGASGFVGGILPVCQNGKWGYVNEKGRMITDFIYDTSEVTSWGNNHMYSALNNYIIVRQDNLWGLIDTDGKTIIDVKYDGISQVNSDGFLWLSENGVWSLYKIDK